MTPEPIRIVLFAQEAGQAAYLETILRMEAPGVFQAVAWRAALPPPEDTQEGGGLDGRCDLLLAVLDVAAGAPAALPVDPLLTPTIVVSPCPPGLPETLSLVRQGAEDVLGLVDLSPRRLVAAILKVMERKARSAPWPRRRPDGLLAWGDGVAPTFGFPLEGSLSFAQGA